MKNFLAFIGLLVLLAAAFFAGIVASDQDILHIIKEEEQIFPWEIEPTSQALAALEWAEYWDGALLLKDTITLK